MVLNPAGQILCDSQPFVSVGSKSQNSQSHLIVMCDHFTLLDIYSTMYSQGDYTPPTSFHLHLLC